MTRKQYSRELRTEIVKETVRPENKGLEHIIAEKYEIMPWTVRRWKEHYLKYG